MPGTWPVQHQATSPPERSRLAFVVLCQHAGSSQGLPRACGKTGKDRQLLRPGAPRFRGWEEAVLPPARK